MAVTLRFLDISGFEIKTETGTTVLIDPFLSGSPELGLPPSPVPAEHEVGRVSLVCSGHAVAFGSPRARL